MPQWMPTKRGYQRQHLIPWSLRNHPMFAQSGRSIHGATNMMYHIGAAPISKSNSKKGKNDDSLSNILCC